VPNRLRTLLASLCIVAAGGAALWVATDGLRVFTTETARRVSIRATPRLLPDVALQDDAGARFALADLRGRWLLVDFIYTRCLSWCNVLGGDFAQLQQRLAAPLRDGSLRLLSISFDPAHDAPAELAAHKRRFGDHGIGWTAARPLDAAGLATLGHAFGLKVVEDGMGGYVHNASIALVDPSGRLVDVFDAGAPRQVAAAVQRRLAQ